MRNAYFLQGYVTISFNLIRGRNFELEVELLLMLDKLSRVSEEHGLGVNETKTKVMMR